MNVPLHSIIYEEQTSVIKSKDPSNQMMKVNECSTNNEEEEGDGGKVAGQNVNELKGNNSDMDQDE